MTSETIVALSYQLAMFRLWAEWCNMIDAAPKHPSWYRK